MKTSHSTAAKTLTAIAATVLMLGTAGIASAQEKASTGAAAGGGVVPNTDKGGSKSATASTGAVQGPGVVTNREKTARKPKKKKTPAAG